MPQETSKALAKTDVREWFAWPPEAQKESLIRNDYVQLLKMLAPALSAAMNNHSTVSSKKVAPEAIKSAMFTLQNKQG